MGGWIDVVWGMDGWMWFGVDGWMDGWMNGCCLENGWVDVDWRMDGCDLGNG